MDFSWGWARVASVLAVVAFAGCGDDGGMGEPDAAFVCATDNQCDDLVFCNGEEVCAPAAEGADARGCVQQDEPCMEGQTCDEDAQECVTDCATGGDADGDGVDSMDCGGDDCDDSDDTRFPGNTEVCDAEGHDEDCDPMTVGDTDADEDGVVDAACCNETDDGTLMCGADCDDTRPDVSGTAVEACDGADNDCDGNVDEGVLATWYEDADGDDFASMDPGAETRMACEKPNGFAATRTDCDDSCAACNPGAPEICDGLDNDCDGTADEDTVPVDWYRDADGDGYGDDDYTPIESCEPVTGHVSRAGDCVDDTSEDPDAASINPLAEDICDGVDNDCDGVLEGEGEDEDGDGFASMSCGGDDCDDTRDTAYPGATEICNRLDDDCSSGGGDEPSEDMDDDGYSSDESSCSAVGGFSKDDCDDDRAEAYPGAPELCNRLDDDCDSGGGEQNAEDADSDGFTAVGYVGCSGGFDKTDCNDDNSSINPAATEICDFTETDDDCDGIPNQTCPSGMWTASPTIVGTTSNSTPCPPGYGLVGFHAQIGDWFSFTDVMTRIAGRCEPYEVVQVGPSTYDIRWNGDLDFELVEPFPEGTQADPLTVCPDGQFVVGINYWNDGDPIIGAEVDCADLRVVNTSGTWSIEVGSVSGSYEFGATPGAADTSRSCPSGTMATGLTGTQESSTTSPPASLGIPCATPNPRLGLDGGCADTTRDGFADEGSNPDVAGCKGAWGVPGMRGQTPQCSHQSGDDFFPIPDPTSCTVEDICAEGWHVCTGTADLPAGTSCGADLVVNLGAEPRVFFATGQGGNGTGCTASGTNDVYGCGRDYGDPAPASCTPLNITAGDQCDAFSSGIECTSSTNEVGTVTNTNAQRLGVLCCRD